MIHSTQNGNGPESRHKVSMQRRHDTHDRGNYSYRARTDNSKLCLHTTSHVPITIWCPCVLVSLCTCVFVCLRSLCFTDGFNALNVYTPQPHTRNNVAIEIASQTAHAVNSRRLGNSGHSGCRRRETRQMFKLYNLQYLYNRRLMYRKSQNSQGTMHKAAAKIL